MIIDLMNHFKYEDKKLEDIIIEYIKKGYQLICIWIGDKEHVLGLSTDKSHQLYYSGFFIYQYKKEQKKILQIREELEQNYDGNIDFSKNSTQVSFVSDDLLRAMIFKAYSTESKMNTFNEYIYSSNDDDFYVEWTFNSNEPDRIILLSPSESYTDISDFLFHWADKYPQYAVNPTWEYYQGVNNYFYLIELGFSEEIVNYIAKKLPYLIYNDDQRSLVKDYFSILNEIFKGDCVKALTDLYFNDKNKFDLFFNCEFAEKHLFQN